MHSINSTVSRLLKSKIRDFAMTLLKKLSLVFVCAIATAINCNNQLFDELKKKFPTAMKDKTLFGMALTSSGLLWATNIGTGKEYKLRRRLLLKAPGLVAAAVGAEYVFNSFNEKYKWVK